MKVNVGDIFLNVETFGVGEPLVLLHGFTGSSASWFRVVPQLANRFRVIAVDLIGHGKSDVPADPERYSMEHCTADIAFLLAQLGTVPANLVGYSMGGRIALSFALAHPGHVRRLVLESASPGLSDTVERAARIAKDEALASSIARDGLAFFVDSWMAQPLFEPQQRLPRDVRETTREQRLRNNVFGLANSLRGLGTGAQPPCWKQLGELTAPTLLIAGEGDPKFRFIAGRMAEQMPAAHTVIIPNAGHTTHLENPQAFVGAVSSFLTGGRTRSDSQLSMED